MNNTEELITQGLNLMLLGMGTVFVFLTILVFVTTLMSSLVLKYSPVSIPKQSQKPEQIKAQPDPTLLAVISAAIHAHRSRK